MKGALEHFAYKDSLDVPKKNDEMLSVSGKVSKRHLVIGRDRLNNKLNPISSVISTWMLKKMSRIRLK